MAYRTIRRLAFVGVTLAAAASIKASILFSGELAIVLASDAIKVVSPSSYPNPSAFNFDLTGDGLNDFSFFTHDIGSATYFSGRGLNRGFYLGEGSSLLTSVPEGASIGAGPQWTSGNGGSPLFSGQNWWAPNFYGFLSIGNFGSQYIGFKVEEMSGTHFGWIQVMRETSPLPTLTITGWAFESTPNLLIAAGDRGIASIPEPGSSGILLSLLALAGVLLGRRQRSEKHT